MSRTSTPSRPTAFELREAAALDENYSPPYKRGQFDTLPKGDAYATAFDTFLRSGAPHLSAEARSVLGAATPVDVASLGPELRQMASRLAESRDLGVATSAAGAALVPQGFADRMLAAAQYFGAVVSVCGMWETETGADAPLPTVNDLASAGGILAENTAIGSSLDPTWTQRMFHSYQYESRIVKASRQLVTDSAFPLGDALADRFGERVGRLLDQHFSTGTGSGQPEGILTNATPTVTAPTGNTVKIDLGSVENMVLALDPAYHRNATWLASPGAWLALMQIVDSQQRPIWTPSSDDSPTPWGRLYGFPVVLAPYFPAPAANAKSLALGDWSRGYIARRVTGRNGEGPRLVTLSERYAELLAMAWFQVERWDGQPGDTRAYKVFAHSAT